MKTHKTLVTALIHLGLVALFLAPLASVATAGHHDRSGKEVVGYFIEWGIYGRNYLVKNVVTSGSADKLTVINYAFGYAAPVDPSDDTSQVVCKLADEWADYQKPWSAEESVDGVPVTWPNPVLGNFQQLRALKASYPNVKVLMSLGGWAGSKWFSNAALTNASRQAFVSSCVDLFIKGNLPNPGWGGMGGPGSAAGVFDGIDVDWEYPAMPGNAGNIVRPEDTANFTALLREFRRQFDALDADLLLTVASPAGPAFYSKIQLDKIGRYVDLVNLMTFEFHGPWETSTGHASNLLLSRADPSAPDHLFSSDRSIRAYLRAGVPPSKLTLATPFYGHGWTGVTDEHHGLFQAAAGPAPGVWEAGSNDYKVLKDLTSSGFTRFWDRSARAPWLFDGTTFWTYDDPQSVSEKGAYVRHNDLAGIMLWDLTGDDADGSLIAAIHDSLSWHSPGGHNCD
jgi:chitinase